METINGISFEDWACACANIAQGLSNDEVCQILGVEMPVWTKTNDEWTTKLGDLMANDMSIATKYGEIFTNPKQGKFANAGAEITPLEDLIKMVPDYDTYQKIFWHQSVASEVGVDTVSIMEEYGFTLQSWATISSYWANWNHEYMDYEKVETDVYNKRFHETTAMRDKWTKHWNEFYADKKVDLGEDIDF